MVDTALEKTTQEETIWVAAFPQDVFDGAMDFARREHVVRMIKYGDKKEAKRIVRRHWVDRLRGIPCADTLYQYGRSPDGLFKDTKRYDPSLI
jgi:hypothetical protein